MNGSFFHRSKQNQENALDVRSNNNNGLPEMMELANRITNIQAMHEAADSQIKLLEQESKLLEVQTRNFVAKQMAMTNNMVMSGKTISTMLDNVLTALSDSDSSYETKKLMMDAFSMALSEFRNSEFMGQLGADRK